MYAKYSESMSYGVGASIATGCSKRPSSKAAANEEARRTRRYVEPLRKARTPLAVFFSILLEVEELVGDFFCGECVEHGHDPSGEFEV